MIWLELRTNNRKYNKGWNLTESIWAPTSRKNGTRWAFWSLVNNVKEGDIIFHLRKDNGTTEFVGYSFANTDAYETLDKPTDHKHEWDFSKPFYKVDLANYTVLEPAIKLSDFFNNNETKLRDYYKNKTKKQRLFYTVQKDKLQCLFGGYFSMFNEFLPNLLVANYEAKRQQNVSENVTTGTALAETALRIGHQVFSENVKTNFNYKCCFPNCEVEGKDFLISGHIARWADDTSLRGNTSNGLCFCLMHDKAFEKGIFTLNQNFKIEIIKKDYMNRKWLHDLLQHGEGYDIKQCEILPSIEALQLHWKRIGFQHLLS